MNNLKPDQNLKRVSSKIAFQNYIPDKGLLLESVHTHFKT
jgi:hypothetical protein